MRRFFYIFIRTVSLAVLVLAVSMVNAHSVLFKKLGKAAKADSKESFFAGAFSATSVFADAPGSDSSGDVTSDSDGDCDGSDSGDDADGC